MITCQGNVGSGWGFAVDNIYLKALGRAVWAFALLEWNAVWCCELLEPNYMHKPESQLSCSLIHSANALAYPFVAGWLRRAISVKSQPVSGVIEGNDVS